MSKDVQTPTSITTMTGFFDYEKPEEYDFPIKEIAHALSNLCRYAGHTRYFYSVAEHSVYVSRLVPVRYALEGLLHDASEAYCVDVPSPMKRLLPGYRDIEDKVQSALAEKHDLWYPFPEEVHTADHMMYRTERPIVTSGTDTIWHTDVQPAKIAIRGVQPIVAYNMFIQRYEEITGAKVEGNGSNPRQAAA